MVSKLQKNARAADVVLYWHRSVCERTQHATWRFGDWNWAMSSALYDGDVSWILIMLQRVNAQSSAAQSNDDYLLRCATCIVYRCCDTCIVYRCCDTCIVYRCRHKSDQSSLSFLLIVTVLCSRSLICGTNIVTSSLSISLSHSPFLHSFRTIRYCH